MPDSPFLIERLLRETLRAAQDESYETEEAFVAAMNDQADEDLYRRRLESLAENPIEMAQELAFEAYESKTEDEALAKVERALEADPECVDALTIHAFITCENAGELIHELEHAATCGEQRLGEEFFAEFMGDFWPMVEARPYMRTIKQLAEVLWNVGRRFDAVDHYENLMDLDPEDHMGNSILLVGYYLSMGEVQRAWDLIEEFDDYRGTFFSWAWVLLFLMIRDEDAARDAVQHAMDINPYVAPLIAGAVEPSDEEIPPYVSPGSEDEAQLCERILGEAWSRFPAAQWWLLDLLSDLGLIGESDDEDTPAPN